ncbi:AAA family ATPase [bacterium]|nr:AAA family ATPase [bacterium]MBT4598008.1 AAA family ATPase [bacterium]MBT7992787.1 AAA family ATPase [bacterium]
MFLKKLEIIGFKSFAKKTSLDFSQTGILNGEKKIGISAIVGPNGSGKSNIADALRWAMGEQSMKYLRGKKTEDIIFAGSGKKAKLGSAQVSIYLDNSKKQIPLEFDEVVITRKVYRNGESEYLVNGAKTRLIDIVDLLARAGIGQRSYCIVNQGMADQILNATPIERRAMLEEAAGVKEFQVKKQRGQRKLVSTKNNLDRVEGLLLEIEPHLRLLKRQSTRAQKGEIYRNQLREKQHSLYGFLWHGLFDSVKKAQDIKSVTEHEVAELQKEVSNIADESQKESKNKISLQGEINELETTQREVNQELNILERKLIIAEGKLALEKERARDIRLVEVIPMGVKVIKTRLSEIKNQQEKLIKRIEGVDDLKQIQEIKEYARAISMEMYDLYEAVVRGKMEKKKPQEEIQKQKSINLKKAHFIMEEIKELKTQKASAEENLRGKQKIITELIGKDQKERGLSIELEDKLRRARFELDRKKDLLNEARIELAKNEVKEEDLSARIRSEMRISPEKLEYNKESIDIAKCDKDINRLKFQLEQIGGIDEAIIEEYKETDKRYNFLSKESQDLHEAMKRLKKVIREMDLKIKDEFEEAFVFINKEFAKYFKIIFNGGKAKLEKIEITKIKRSSQEKENKENYTENSSFEAEEEKEDKQIGIEIFAEPAGKKITNLGMLSGGERTLTSIAMLFAIISYNPPPFAFLDEIEAALDEANSKRFSKILNELSGKTQFVLISHNRQTMREAALLYGVTMGDDGISKLLSVKLDQVGLAGEIKKN